MLAVHTLIAVGRRNRNLSVSQLARDVQVNRVHLTEVTRLRRHLPVRCYGLADAALGYAPGSFALAAANEATLSLLSGALRKRFVHDMSEVFSAFIVQAGGGWLMRADDGPTEFGMEALALWVCAVMNAWWTHGTPRSMLYPRAIDTAQGPVLSPGDDALAFLATDPRPVMGEFHETPVVYLPLLRSFILTDDALVAKVLGPRGPAHGEREVRISRSV